MLLKELCNVSDNLWLRSHACTHVRHSLLKLKQDPQTHPPPDWQHALLLTSLTPTSLVSMRTSLDQTRNTFPFCWRSPLLMLTVHWWSGALEAGLGWWAGMVGQAAALHWYSLQQMLVSFLSSLSPPQSQSLPLSLSLSLFLVSISALLLLVSSFFFSLFPLLLLFLSVFRSLSLSPSLSLSRNGALENKQWTHWDLNPGPSACEADVIPLSPEWASCVLFSV